MTETFEQWEQETWDSLSVGPDSRFGKEHPELVTEEDTERRREWLVGYIARVKETWNE